MTELGFGPEVDTDSSMAKSFVSTRGLGNKRHLDVKLLWLQECVQRSLRNVRMVSGATNVADASTKYHDAERLRTLCQPHGIFSGPDGKDRRAEGGATRNPLQVKLKGSAQTLGHDTFGGWVDGSLGQSTRDGAEAL